MTTEDRLAAIEDKLDKIFALLVATIPPEAVPQHLWTPERTAMEALRQKGYYR